MIAERGGAEDAAIASALAAEIYGLEILRRNVEDASHNTTRFYVMSRWPAAALREGHWVTTFVFRVRNIPAALYKALGGFATNGVNMTKLESYMVTASSPRRSSSPTWMAARTSPAWRRRAGGIGILLHASCASSAPTRRIAYRLEHQGR